MPTVAYLDSQIAALRSRIRDTFEANPVGPVTVPEDEQRHITKAFLERHIVRLQSQCRSLQCARESMEFKARRIFRDALAMHYIDGIGDVGAAVDGWLTVHGGWLPDPQEVYGDGTPPQPRDEGPWAMASFPAKAMEDARSLMVRLRDALDDDLILSSVKRWLDDCHASDELARERSRERDRSPRRVAFEAESYGHD